ncbi:hypothetical protein P7K49_009682 [Saguinus oedipus]|uniref:Basic proline-rich protein-like n=1 Tax=Saguinus oedipus TaxID=9490 RepID=A0ABQ9VKN2_SAGOE|nr:hypothetical protein P7K49_009682 [Saguinus oedipus]
MAQAHPASTSLGREPARLRLPPLGQRLPSAHLGLDTASPPHGPPRGLSTALGSESAARPPPGAPAPATAPPGARPLGLAAPPEGARDPAARTPIAPSGCESGCGPGPGSARRGPPPAQPRQLPAPPPRLGDAPFREQKADAAGAAGREAGRERGRDLRGNSDPLEGQAGAGSRCPASLLLRSAASSPAHPRNAPGGGPTAPGVLAGPARAAGAGTPGPRPIGPQFAGACIHARRAPRPSPGAEPARTPPTRPARRSRDPIAQMRTLKPGCTRRAHGQGSADGTKAHTSRARSGSSCLGFPPLA